MKNQLPLISFFSAALLLVLGCGCRQSVTPPKAQSPFHPAQTQGQVRVVLLRACPVASPTNPTTFAVTYGVEIPTNGAFSDLSFRSDEEIALSVGGKPIKPQGAIASAAMGFNHLPRPSELRQPPVENGKALLCEEITFTGLRLDAQQVDLRIRFSCRGSPRTFDFQHVPTAYRSANSGT